LIVAAILRPARGEGEWEVTPASRQAVDLGLEWLAQNQGATGNWESRDLGLVSLGALAFMSAGHAPHRGRYGDNVRRALDYVINNARPSGLLNIENKRRDMYNHGLTVFVLTQAYGLADHPKLSATLDRGIRLICDVQCGDGGWDYEARRLPKGHDLSLAVMQAKALRGATDIGLEIPPRTTQLAIASVRSHYHPGARTFTYTKGGRSTPAMAAAGAVCLQEYGAYADVRIQHSMDFVGRHIKTKMEIKEGELPLNGYTMYYVAQGLYQVGGARWRDYYPLIRDAIVKSQVKSGGPEVRGSWNGGYVKGVPGLLFGTSVGVFALSIPNRYLPILQQGDVAMTEDAGSSRR
jgi:hypothetical protein